MDCVLSSGYWPNLHYWWYVLNSKNCQLDSCEHYQKQSYRNRMQILTANGVLDLSIPIEKNAHKEILKEVRISYTEPWQNNHWRAITSAYKNSPYFEFFENEISVFYSRPFSNLFDYNTEQLHCVLKLLKLKKEIGFSKNFEKQIPSLKDLRTLIHPKRDFRTDEKVKNLLAKPYYQTFSYKFEFFPNLSILDLLFNTGLDALPYLKAGEGENLSA